MATPVVTLRPEQRDLPGAPCTPVSAQRQGLEEASPTLLSAQSEAKDKHPARPSSSALEGLFFNLCTEIMVSRICYF